VPGVGERRQQIHLRCGLEWLTAKIGRAANGARGADVDQFEPLPSTLARRRINAGISLTGLLGWMR
jgi:hypothetical protein